MADWTDLSTRKVSKYLFEYVAGDEVPAFTMVNDAGYLAISNVRTSVRPNPQGGSVHEDWEGLGYINDSPPGQSNQPFINITTTQRLDNTYTVVGTGNDNLWPPSTPQPLVGGNYEGYMKVAGLENNDAIGYVLRDALDNIIPVGDNSPQEGTDIEFTSTGKVRVDGFADFKHSANNATVAFVFALEVNGFYSFSPRPVKHRVPNGEDSANMAGEGVLPVSATGWKTSLWIASDVSGVITVDTLSIILSKFADI